MAARTMLLAGHVHQAVLRLDLEAAETHFQTLRESANNDGIFFHCYYLCSFLLSFLLSPLKPPHSFTLMFSADEIVVQAARQGLDQARQAAARAAADTETRASKRKLSLSPAPNAHQASAQSAESSSSSLSAITTSTTSSANKALRPEPAQIPSVGGSAAASPASDSQETPTAVQLAEDPDSPNHEFLLFLRNELRFQLDLQKNFMNANDYISISDLIADLLVERTKTETDTAVLDLCQGKLGPAGRLIRALRKRLPPHYKPIEGGYERFPESDTAL
jgi:hypothetical protein